MPARPPAGGAQLVAADAGGRDGCRLRLREARAGRLAAVAGLEITVCRVAAGASRWSKVERGLVSRIFLSWALSALGGSRRLLDP
jgi:Rhodopirellula transposase DDE domain